MVFTVHAVVAAEPVNTMFEPDMNTPNERPDVDPKEVVVVSV